MIVVNLERYTDDGFKTSANSLNASAPDRVKYVRFYYNDFLGSNFIQGEFVNGYNSTVQADNESVAYNKFKMFTSTDGIYYTENKSYGGDYGYPVNDSLKRQLVLDASFVDPGGSGTFGFDRIYSDPSGGFFDGGVINQTPHAGLAGWTYEFHCTTGVGNTNSQRIEEYYGFTSITSHTIEGEAYFITNNDGFGALGGTILAITTSLLPDGTYGRLNPGGEIHYGAYVESATTAGQFELGTARMTPLLIRMEIKLWATKVSIPPVLVLPTKGYTETSSSTITFSWLAVNGAVNYELQVCNDLTFTILLVDIVTAALSSVQVLGANDEYSWRVRANMGGGSYTNWSTARLLTVNV